MYDYNSVVSYSTYGTLFGGLLAFAAIISIVALVLGVFMLICMWKVFKKAGKPGWASIIPIYNIIVILEIANLPFWYLFLFLIPFVNIYIMVKIYISLAHSFGKSTGFGVLLALLPIIGFPILAFGKNTSGTAPQMETNNMVNNNPGVSYQGGVQSQPQAIISNLEDNAGLSFNPIPNTQINNHPVTPMVEPVPVNIEPMTPVVPTAPVTPVMPAPVTPEPMPQPVNVEPVAPTPEVVVPTAPVTPAMPAPVAPEPMAPVMPAPMSQPVNVEPVAPVAPTPVAPAQTPLQVIPGSTPAPVSAPQVATPVVPTPMPQPVNVEPVSPTPVISTPTIMENQNENR